MHELDVFKCQNAQISDMNTTTKKLRGELKDTVKELTRAKRDLSSSYSHNYITSEEHEDWKTRHLQCINDLRKQVYEQKVEISHLTDKYECAERRY